MSTYLFDFQPSSSSSLDAARERFARAADAWDEYEDRREPVPNEVRREYHYAAMDFWYWSLQSKNGTP